MADSRLEEQLEGLEGVPYTVCRLMNEMRELDSSSSQLQRKEVSEFGQMIHACRIPGRDLRDRGVFGRSRITADGLFTPLGPLPYNNIYSE